MPDVDVNELKKVGKNLRKTSDLNQAPKPKTTQYDGMLGSLSKNIDGAKKTISKNEPQKENKGENDDDRDDSEWDDDDTPQIKQVPNKQATQPTNQQGKAVTPPPEDDPPPPPPEDDDDDPPPPPPEDEELPPLPPRPPAGPDTRGKAGQDQKKQAVKPNTTRQQAGRATRGTARPATRGTARPATRGTAPPATRGTAPPATRGTAPPATRGTARPIPPPPKDDTPTSQQRQAGQAPQEQAVTPKTQWKKAVTPKTPQGKAVTTPRGQAVATLSKMNGDLQEQSKQKITVDDILKSKGENIELNALNRITSMKGIAAANIKSHRVNACISTLKKFFKNNSNTNKTLEYLGLTGKNKVTIQINNEGDLIKNWKAILLVFKNNLNKLTKKSIVLKGILKILIKSLKTK